MNLEAYSPSVPFDLYLTWKAGCHSTHSDTFLIPCYSGRSHWKAESKWDTSPSGFSYASRTQYSRSKSKIKSPNKGIFVLIWQSANITGEKITTRPVKKPTGLFTTGLYCAKYSNYDINNALYLYSTFHPRTSKPVKKQENRTSGLCKILVTISKELIQQESSPLSKTLWNLQLKTGYRYIKSKAQWD